ncbi:MAG TPA: hypothetical protein VE685_26175 [Thermoanaerobaculia bacterium]|nr:hypothetical protein [Thermoanaerobaculia bacterium]
MRTHGRIILWICGFFLTASSAFAAEWQAVLGANGEVYVAKTGAYGQLFHGVRPSDAANRVLVLEVTPPGEATRRILVPGTDDTEEEKAPALIYEDRSETVYLVWQSQFSIHPILRLTAYDGEWWPKPLEITGNPFAPKTSPQLALTRDSYKEMVTENELVTRQRTILHLLWEEEKAAGDMLETFYSPIVFVDGVYIGRNPVFQLDELLRSEEADATAALSAPSSLVRSPTIQSGRDGRTVVIAYVSSMSGRLVSVEVDALPQELGNIADKARSHIIDLGRELRDLPRDLPSIAGKARSHIIDLGRAFHREIIDSVAAQVYTKIIESDAPDIESFADKARSHIIDLGAKLSARGLRNPGKVPAKIAEIASFGPDEEGGTMLLQVRAASSRPAPQIDAAEPVLFLSESGEEVLIAWQDHKQNRVLYRDSKGADWNGVREIKLSDSLPLSRAYEVLRQRVRNR